MVTSCPQYVRVYQSQSAAGADKGLSKQEWLSCSLPPPNTALILARASAHEDKGGWGRREPFLYLAPALGSSQWTLRKRLTSSHEKV